jgi:peptidoglycan/LPS O-acetylase OafA/YrhL
MLRKDRSNSAYRIEINGLRAISVLAVLLYHTGLGILPSGYLGVDIFFVISGYLITEILLIDISKNACSYVNFYERRARRILPALIFVLFMSLFSASVILLPRDLKRFSDSLVSSPIFLSNFYFYLNSNYFDTSSELKLLIHTWSIALEWQFYLFFPAIFIFLHKKCTKNFIHYALTVVLASLFWNFYSKNFSANFYFLPARLWEFMTGSLVAVLRPKILQLLDNRKFGIVSNLGIVMILYSFTLAHQDEKNISFIKCIPVLGTLFVLLCFKSQIAFSKILTNKYAVLIGLISYSIYLSHQPIFSLLRRLDFYYAYPELCIFLGITLTFVVSLTLWRYVEIPFRDEKFISTKLFLYFSCVSVLIIVSTGLFIHVNNGFPERLPAIARQYLIAEHYERALLKTGCVLKGQYFDLEKCKKGYATSPQYILIGDSHAQSIVQELSKAFNANKISFLPFTLRSCPFGGSNNDHKSLSVCDQYQSAAFQVLLNQNIEYVIILSRWDNSTDGVYYSHETYLDQMDAIKRLLAMRKKVIFIQPIPAYTVPISDYMATQSWRGKGLDNSLILKKSEYIKRIDLEANLIKNFISDPNFIYISTEDIFCGEGIGGICIYHIDGAPLYSDESHLTNLGALKIVRKIMQILEIKSN